MFKLVNSGVSQGLAIWFILYIEEKYTRIANTAIPSVVKKMCVLVNTDHPLNKSYRFDHYTCMDRLKQDLHIHTVFSTGDGAVAPQQTVELIEELNHAEIRGISDHFEYLRDEIFEIYRTAVHSRGFWCGCEINDSADAAEAVHYPYDYFIYHCRDREPEYRGAELLLQTGKPLILSHPMAMGADLNRVPTGCYLEINNRYIWKGDYQAYFTPHLERFHFTIGSDAHQPNWLNHLVARHAANKLGIEETLLFSHRYKEEGDSL